MENLNSVNYVRTGLKKHIGPAEVKRITQQAIRHFATVNFDELSDLISIPDDVDIYGSIAAKYPLAWAALCQIGNSEDSVISLQPVVQDKEPIYTDRMSSRQDKSGVAGNIKVTLDGYSKTIDPTLQAYLFEIRDNERDCIYFDSFKMVTRNAEKILYIINYILTYNGAFCTANYFITNGYIERRVSCLPPTSSDADFLASA